MAEDKKSVSENTDTTESTPVESEALQSFLDRETSDKANEKKNGKTNKKPSSVKWLIIGAVVIALIIGVVVLLNMNPQTVDTTETDLGTDVNTSVDDKGTHQAEPVLNEDGELDNNSYGTLMEYTPSQIKQIDISNESGNYTITAYTPTDSTESEDSESATVYTLVGFEDFSLKSGGADAIANDVAALSFTSVADVAGDNASDYGFDSPRATVKTTFTDDTSSIITVGNDAPKDLGVYIMFGDSKTVYVVDSESADGFLFSVLDLMDLTINDTPSDTANTEIQSLKISGSGFDDTIELRSNSDKAIDSSYVMITPKKMFVNEVEASNITGAIRGLYADKAVCVNPDSKQLQKYGLSAPYAKIVAVYPDETIEISVSKPKDDNVYLKAKGSNVIYQITSSSVPWATTSVSKLTPQTIIDPNFASVTGITVTDDSGTYKLDVTTKTETVTNDSGEEEQVDSTTAKYNGKELDSTNYGVFFQNIASMQNAGSTSQSPSSSPALTITISYSTGRANDTVTIYKTNSTKYIAALNGEVVGQVYKSYCTKFSSSIQNLIKGETVQSF